MRLRAGWGQDTGVDMGQPPCPPWMSTSRPPRGAVHDGGPAVLAPRARPRCWAAPAMLATVAHAAHAARPAAMVGHAAMAGHAPATLGHGGRRAPHQGWRPGACAPGGAWHLASGAEAHQTESLILNGLRQSRHDTLSRACRVPSPWKVGA